jgi:hypothetical protein
MSQQDLGQKQNVNSAQPVANVDSAGGCQAVGVPAWALSASTIRSLSFATVPVSMAGEELDVEKSNHRVGTRDGWSLHLVRTRAADRSCQQQGPRFPVLLVPGLACGGQWCFDCGPVGPSLVDWLAIRGWDVWVCDLRGGHVQRG